MILSSRQTFYLFAKQEQAGSNTYSKCAKSSIVAANQMLNCVSTLHQ